jgi:hypothetical protein
MGARHADVFQHVPSRYLVSVCGLVDMHHYAGDGGAMPLLERVTAYDASVEFSL